MMKKMFTHLVTFFSRIDPLCSQAELPEYFCIRLVVNFRWPPAEVASPFLRPYRLLLNITSKYHAPSIRATSYYYANEIIIVLTNQGDALYRYEGALWTTYAQQKCPSVSRFCSKFILPKWKESFKS